MAELRNWLVEITAEVVKQYSTVARSLEEAEENATQDFLTEYDCGSDIEVNVVSAVAVADDESAEVEEDD